MGNTSIADLPAHIQKQVREKLEAESAQQLYNRIASAELAKRSKYRNVRTEFKSVQGFTVMADSKLEARLFARLDQEMVRGDVAWWIPHPRFPLPGGVVYEADALVMERFAVPGNAGGALRPRVYDAKGFDRQDARNKRKQVLDLFGVDVELVRK